MVKNLPAMRDIQVQSLGREDSPEDRNGNPLQYSGLENSVDRGAWKAAGCGVTKSWTQLSEPLPSVCVDIGGLPGGHRGKGSAYQCRRHSDVGSMPGSGRPPEEEMAIHSSMLAWKTPRTEEPGGLQPMGCQSRAYTHMNIGLPVS